MSFASEVKAELSKNISSARHCQIAMLSAMISMVADVYYQDLNPVCMSITTERSVIAGTISRLIRKLFGIVPDASVRRTGKNSRIYHMVISDAALVQQMMATLKLTIDTDVHAIEKKNMRYSCQDMNVNRIVVQQGCCKRAFIKGVFMTSGSISDPNKGYHMELVCNHEKRAALIESLIKDLGIEGKTIKRKKYSVVYIKDGTMIVDMLNIMGAHISLMNMENIRILKDISNNVNRRVNCEAANLNKTVSAAVRQIQDIQYISITKGIQYLPENLRRLAEIRLEAPDASLKELGEMMNPPIGKSGVNHRLRKISEIADELRKC